MTHGAAARAPRPARMSLLLGLLSTVGAFSIDAFFPALRAISQEFHLSSLQAQQTLTVYMFSYALASLFHGSLSDALGRHPKVFDDLFVNLVAAGESGGILDGILQRLSVYMEKAMKLKRRVKGAMVYPISIVGIAALVITILLTKVIPVFEKMFKDFGGGKLPMPTQVVINVSHALAHYLPFIVGFLIAGGIALRMVLRTE